MACGGATDTPKKKRMAFGSHQHKQKTKQKKREVPGLQDQLTDPQTTDSSMAANEKKGGAKKGKMRNRMVLLREPPTHTDTQKKKKRPQAQGPLGPQAISSCSSGSTSSSCASVRLGERELGRAGLEGSGGGGESPTPRGESSLKNNIKKINSLKKRKLGLFRKKKMGCQKWGKLSSSLNLWGR